MRFILVLAASSTLAYLFAQLLHFRVPLALNLYVAWMFLCTSVAYLALQKVKLDEDGYANFFILTMAPAACLALGLAVHFAKGLELRHGGRLIILAALFFASLVRMLTEMLPHSRQRDITLAQGYLFCLAGLITLISLALVHPALGFMLRLALGLYWLTVGAYSFCLVTGIVRSRALWLSVNGWFVSTACILFLGGLALALKGAHHELGPQHARDEAPTHLVWETEES